MDSNNGSIYLCCRPSVSHSITLALFHALRAAGLDVYVDFDNGEVTLAQQFDLIDSHPHFLVVLTPAHLERFHEPDDRLRQQIEHAAQSRRNLIPALTYGFNFAHTIVPEEIAFLRRYRALTVKPDGLEAAAAQLCSQYLNAHIFGEITPVPDEDSYRRQIDAAARLPLPTPEVLRAETLFNQAFTLGRQEFAGKIALFDEVIRLNPAYNAARFHRALTRRRSGDERGALADYDDLLSRNPHHHKGLNNRAEIRFSLGDIEGALDDYNCALAEFPGYVMARMGKAITLYALRQTAEALNLWRSLVADDHRFLDAGWVGRELRLPPAMIDELHHFALHVSLNPDMGLAAPDV